MHRIAVLISGQGRNLQALIEAARDGRIAGEIAGVVSNRADAAGLARASAAGIASRILPHEDYARRADFDDALSAALDAWSVDTVALAGFMRVLGDDFVRRFRGRLINIHPSLLPRHPGLRTHERVLENGDHKHGATVHFVTEQLDGGAAIIQGGFMVRPQDTADMLADRVMNEIELRIFPQAVAWMARGDLRLQDDRTWFRGAPLPGPLSPDDLEPAFK